MNFTFFLVKYLLRPVTFTDQVPFIWEVFVWFELTMSSRLLLCLFQDWIFIREVYILPCKFELLFCAGQEDLPFSIVYECTSKSPWDNFWLVCYMENSLMHVRAMIHPIENTREIAFFHWGISILTLFWAKSVHSYNRLTDEIWLPLQWSVCVCVCCLSDKLASQYCTIKQWWNKFGKEKLLLNLCQMLFIELKGIRSGFIFIMSWSMKMHAFYSVLTNKPVFLLIICRCLSCLVSGMNAWKKQIKNSLSVFLHADETHLNEYSCKENTRKKQIG